MMRAALRYARKAPQVARYVAADPLEVWLRIGAKFIERRERRKPTPPYQTGGLGKSSAHSPCGALAVPKGQRVLDLVPEVIEGLHTKGLKVGVGFFRSFNNGKPELVRAI
jgi:hypothetical protein